MPPPQGWSTVPPPSEPLPVSRSTATPGADSTEAVGAAWKHVRNVVSRDEARTPDLFDLLSHSVRETQYSFQPQGVSGWGQPALWACWLVPWGPPKAWGIGPWR